MALLKLNNLGSQSINFDLEHCDLPPEILTYGANYRLINNKIYSFNASKLLTTPPSNFYAGFIISVLGTSGNFYLLLGRTAAWVYNGTAWTNITSAIGYAALGANDELLWQGCKLGSIPIVNNPVHYPEYWSPQQTSTILKPLKFDAATTWQAKGYHTKIIRSHKDFLFALNLTEGAVEFPSSYRWSHPADINGLPFSWDETDLSTIAGKASLSGASGAIIDGLSLRDSFCIYSERAINILDYVGGEFIWSRRVLTESHGLLAKNCVVEALGIHYFLSDGDIMANNGNTVESILHKKLKSRLTDSLDPDYYKNSFAYHNPIAKEIWFCIPEIGNSLPTLAIIYNYVDGTTSTRSLNGGWTGITFGPVLGTPVTWANATDTWASASKVWSYDPTSQFSKNIVGTNNVNSAIHSLELDDDNTVQNTILERLSLPIVDQETVITTSRVFPHMTCKEQVLIQLGSQDFVGAPVRWKPAVLFDPTTQRKVDIRTTGKLLSWRISSTGNLPFTLTGLDIEYETNGVR